MSTKEYLLTWQWKDSKTVNSFNTLSTKHKPVVDKMLKCISDNAVNIHLISYDNKVAEFHEED